MCNFGWIFDETLSAGAILPRWQRMSKNLLCIQLEMGEQKVYTKVATGRCFSPPESERVYQDLLQNWPPGVGLQEIFTFKEDGEQKKESLEQPVAEVVQNWLFPCEKSEINFYTFCVYPSWRLFGSPIARHEHKQWLIARLFFMVF